MKGKNLITLIVIVIALAGVWFFAHTSHITKPTRKIETIVAFGDSLVQGVGASEGNDFVSLLSRKISRPIINKGISGDTTAEGLARIQGVLDLHPDMVILLLGGNDVLQHISSEETFKNLDTIISTFQKQGITVVLLGIEGGILTDPYESKFHDLAKKYKIAYVSNVLSGLIGHDNLMFDSVHPNDAGYKKIADRVYDAISPLLK